MILRKKELGMPPANEAADRDVEHSETIAVAKSEFLAVLANRHRLHILILLSKGECSVGDLMRALGETSVAVSRNLTILRENGIVRARRGGKMVYYSLVSGHVTQMLNTLTDIYCTQGGDAQPRTEAAKAESLAPNRER